MNPVKPPHSAFPLGASDSFTKTITEADVSNYAGLVGDFNPLHVDAEYARKTRFGQRTAHAMLAVGLVSAVLHNRLPGAGSTLLSQQMEFLAPVFIGDTIRAQVEVIEWQPEKRLVTLRTDCYNQDGQQVLTGQAVLMTADSHDGSNRIG